MTKISLIYYDYSSFVRQDFDILSRHFGVAKSRVKLVHGAASKQKIFEIEK